MTKIIDWDEHIGRHLRLRDLRVLSAVVQLGSMAKAAAQFRVSQPAISQVVAGLEQSLAVKLLERGPRGVQPTIYGSALLSRARAAFDELRQGIRDIEFLEDPKSGELRIGCSEAFCATIVPPIICRFQKAYPRVMVRVDDVPPMHEQSALHERRHDLILGRWVRQPPANIRAEDLNVEILFNDHVVVAAGAQSPWARRRKIDLSDLIDEPWVLPGGWIYAATEEAFLARGLGMPRIAVFTYSVPLRGHALANGPYIASLARSTLRFCAERHALKMLPVDLAYAPRPVVVMTLKNRALSPLVERFIECARAEAKLTGPGSSAAGPAMSKVVSRATIASSRSPAETPPPLRR